MKTHIASLVVGAVLVAIFCGCGPSDSKSKITGLADQNVLSWDATAKSVARRLDLPQVRYVTSWDVALHKTDDPCALACQRYQELKGFIDRTRSTGKTDLITFGDAAGCEESCSLPTLAQYEAAVNAFLKDFPTVKEFTAWNEPNHRNRVDAKLAADYWRVLDSRCHDTRGTCIVAAGDLNETGDFRQYTDAYRARLSATDAIPTVWAIHPYAAVDSGDFDALLDWIDNYTDKRSVWFTEVGAFYCSPARKRGGGGLKGTTPEQALEYQKERAHNLNSLLAKVPARVDRTYYYFLAKPNGQQENCPGFDSALIGAGGKARPALKTLFPQLTN